MTVSGSTEVESVTPAQAQEWLDNRSPLMTSPLRPEKVAHFVKVIEAGEWDPHRSYVRIRNGVLRNGQHRLTAIAETGQTLDIRVTRHTVTEP